MTLKGLGEFKIMVLRETTETMDGDTAQSHATYWLANIATAQWFDAEKEHSVVIALNTRKRIIGHNLVSIGGLDSVCVHPREIFKPLIVAGASCFVLMHNHPSGDPGPSKSDIKQTRDIIQAGQLLKIELLDHVIMGSGEKFSSMNELGHFYY